MALAAMALTGCAATTTTLHSLSEDQRRQSLRALQASDLRVATVAYRLAAAGNEICPRKSPLTGMTLHDTAQYAPELRGLLRLADGVALLAVVAGGPADKAGLRAGDTLRAIGQSDLPPVRAGAKATYANVSAAYGTLETAARTGAVALLVERAGLKSRFTLEPVSGCISRVQLIPSTRLWARADGTNVSLTTAMLAYVRSDDELALVVAHEMAHNALGHWTLPRRQGSKRAVLGSSGANAAKILEAERAADRLGYYLMARAGFDVGSAPFFWERLYNGPAADGSAPTTHPGGDARIAEAGNIAAEITSKLRDGQALLPEN